jgi:hypothetical protein
LVEERNYEDLVFPVKEKFERWKKEVPQSGARY